jgi:hypothetical protein
VATTANKIKYPPDRYDLSGGRRLALKDAAAALSAAKHAAAIRMEFPSEVSDFVG